MSVKTDAIFNLWVSSLAFWERFELAPTPEKQNPLVVEEVREAIAESIAMNKVLLYQELCDVAVVTMGMYRAKYGDAITERTIKECLVEVDNAFKYRDFQIDDLFSFRRPEVYPLFTMIGGAITLDPKLWRIQLMKAFVLLMTCDDDILGAIEYTIAKNNAKSYMTHFKDLNTGKLTRITK